MFKYLVYAAHLLAAALHISRTHLLCDGQALFLGNWGEALGLEEINASAFGAEVRLEANENEWGVRAEMENFGIPLRM